MLIIDFATLVGLLALSQAILLSFYLALSAKKQPAAWIFIPLLLVITVGLGHDVFLHSRLSLWFPQTLGFGPIHTYLIGPLILLFVLKLIHPGKPLSYWHFLHFLPFVWHFITRIPIMFQSTSDKLAVLENYYSRSTDSVSSLSLTLDGFLGLVSFYGHRFAYIGFAFYLLIKSKEHFQFALFPRQIARKTLALLLLLYCAFWLSIRIGYYLPSISNQFVKASASLNSIGLSLITILIAMGLFKYRLSEIFSSKSSQKYEKSGLDRTTSKFLMGEIDKVMTDKQLFTIPDLKQSDLAAEMNLSNQQISQAINQIQNESFNDYINRYRINYFEQIVKDGKDTTLNISQLALECGFSSKATFYRVFKEKLGMTPSEFISSLDK